VHGRIVHCVSHSLLLSASFSALDSVTSSIRLGPAGTGFAVYRILNCCLFLRSFGYLMIFYFISLWNPLTYIALFYPHIYVIFSLVVGTYIPYLTPLTPSIRPTSQVVLY